MTLEDRLTKLYYKNRKFTKEIGSVSKEISRLKPNEARKVLEMENKMDNIHIRPIDREKLRKQANPNFISSKMKENIDGIIMADKIPQMDRVDKAKKQRILKGLKSIKNPTSKQKKYIQSLKTQLRRK